jgi:hypothetical protein
MARWSVEGARNAVPEGERRRSRDAIVRAAAEVSQARLREAVLEEGRSRKEPAPVALTVQGPRSVEQRSSYRDAVTGGIDTIVEVALVRVSLEVAGTATPRGTPLIDFWSLWTYSFASSQVDPALRMVAEVRLRLISAADDAVLFEKVFVWRAGWDHFRGWARDGAAQFRKAGDQAIENLARLTADEVFGPHIEKGTKEEPR